MTAARIRSKRLALRRLVLCAIAVLLIAWLGLVGLRVLYPIHSLDLIRNVASDYALDPAVLCAVIRAESRFRPLAISPEGASGWLQVLPETALWIAPQIPLDLTSQETLLEPEVNLRLGSWYLRSLLDQFGDLETALMAYNAGPGRVRQWLETGDNPFPETLVYVHRVQHAIAVYRMYLHAPIIVQITPSLSL